MGTKEKVKAKASKAPPPVVEDDDEEEAAPAAKKVKKPKAGVCLFSGDPTGGGNFRPGFDAKMKGLLIRIVRGELKLSAIDELPDPAAVRSRLKSEKGLVGFRLEGKELIKIGNFEISDGKKKAKKAATKAEQGKAGKDKLKQSKAAVEDDDVEDDDESAFEDDED